MALAARLARARQKAPREPPVRDPHQYQRGGAITLAQQRKRCLVADPGPHLGLEVERTPPPREVVERPVTQPAQGRELAHDLVRAAPLVAGGFDVDVHIEQRIRGHEVDSAIARRAAIRALHQGGDHEHGADQDHREREAVEGQPRAQRPHRGVLARPPALVREPPGRRSRRSRSTKSITSGTPSRW